MASSSKQRVHNQEPTVGNLQVCRKFTQKYPFQYRGTVYFTKSRPGIFRAGAREGSSEYGIISLKNVRAASKVKYCGVKYIELVLSLNTIFITPREYHKLLDFLEAQ